MPPGSIRDLDAQAAVSPLWQRTSQPVTLTAVFTETDPLYRGDVWAEVDGPDPATRYLAPGAPWQTTFTGGQEGPYTATVRAKDRAGNVATGDEKGFILDSTPPGLALTLTSAPPFGYIVTDSVYYGDGSGVFTLTKPALSEVEGSPPTPWPASSAWPSPRRPAPGRLMAWAAPPPQPALTPMPSTPTTP